MKSEIQTASIDARGLKEPDTMGGTHMSGRSPSGTTLSVNRIYFERNGKPWFPLMGEFHYNRYPSSHWEEEIVKMKSAGLSIVSTYVFWNAHEGPKGSWNWEDDLDLRTFIQLCHRHKMFVWLRIGPWCHGEQLHGGHPDWINDMSGKRSNDSAYLKEVEQLYSQIAQQSKELFFQDGGPIIGIQLENEYASGDQDHIGTLKKIALANGLTPVFFSITANTVFHDDLFEALPLQGGYPYRGWEAGGGKATKDFLYANDQWILTDALGKLYYGVDKYVRGMCEQGCGSQMTYKNRFIVQPEIIEAHLQNQIGRGMNQIGYYMFHGGTQQPGLKEPGYPESYDFQAPIGEFGFLRPSYRYLKILHHFLNDFGSTLATMQVVKPVNPIRDELNTKDLRYVARVNGEKGFVFLNNAQVRIDMPNKKVKVNTVLQENTLKFPMKPFNLKGESTAILPINMNLGQTVLKYSTAQPLAQFSALENIALFLTDLQQGTVELALDSRTFTDLVAKGWSITKHGEITHLATENSFFDPITFKDRDGQQIIIKVLTRSQAENAWRTEINGQESLIVSSADLLLFPDHIECRQLDSSSMNFDVYPKPSTDLLVNGEVLKPDAIDFFYRYKVSVPDYHPNLDLQHISPDQIDINLPEILPNHVADLALELMYYGSHIVGKVDDKVVADHLFYGPPWLLGLRRYIGEKKTMSFEVHPWNDQITGVSDRMVEMIKSNDDTITNIKTVPQYRAIIKFL